MKFNFMKEIKKKRKLHSVWFFISFQILYFFFIYNKKSNSVVFRKNHLKFKEWRPLFGNKRHITWVKLVWKVYIKKKEKQNRGKRQKNIIWVYYKMYFDFFFIYNIFHSYYYSYVSTINLTIKCSFSIVSIVSEQLNLRGKNYWIATVINGMIYCCFNLF